MSLEICRICGGNKYLKHVFREGSEELLDQIRLCANIQMHEHDFLPKYVCDTCEHGLAFSYRLRKRGEETEKKLREELFTASTNEFNLLNNEEIQVSDDLILDESNDELWVQDEDTIQVGELDEFGNEGEESDEYALHSMSERQSNETELWSPDQEEVLCENIEIVQDVDIEYEEVKLTDLVYEAVEEGSECDREGAEVECYPDDQKTPLSPFTCQKTLTAGLKMECETCGELFDTRSEYSEHIRSHGDMRYQCLICDKWFNARYRFEQHVKNHSSEKGAYSCPKCSNSYTNQHNLDRHIRSAHNGEKRFQCSECGANFGRADILKMHMAKHSNERNVECEICQKKFKTTQHLHYHKKSHVAKCDRPAKPVRLKPKPKPKPKATHQVFLCEYCEKISHHRTTHLNHMRIHTGEKPYKCDTCDKAFRTSHARSNHMLLHTDKRPHVCQVCSMSFRQRAHLKSHMLVHAGVKKHICEHCQRAFTMKNNLVVHMRMHNGEGSLKPNRGSKRSGKDEPALSHIDDEETVEDVSSNLNEMEDLKNMNSS